MTETENEYPRSIYRLTPVQASNLFFYLIGYCKNDEPFREGLVQALDMHDIVL